MKRLIFLLSLIMAIVLQVSAQDSRDIVKRNVTVNNELKLMNLADSDTAFLWVKADGTVDTLGITQIINIYENHGVKLWTETTSGVLSPFKEANDLLNLGSGVVPGINGGAGIALPISGAGFKIKSNGSGDGGNLAIDAGDGTDTGGKIYIAGGDGTTTEGDVILGVTISEGPASTRGRVLVGTPNRVDEALMLVYGDLSVYDTLRLQGKGIKFPDGTYQETAASGSDIWTASDVTIFNTDQTKDIFLFGDEQSYSSLIAPTASKMFFDRTRSSFYAGKIMETGVVLWDLDNAGSNNAIFGSDNIIPGNYGMIAGFLNIITGNFSFTVGSDNISEYDYNYELGQGLITYSDHEIALGKWNTFYVPDSLNRQRILSIGNGTNSRSESNALTIWKSGAAEITGTLQVGDTSIYHNEHQTTPLPGSIGREGDTLYVYQDNAWVRLATDSGGPSLPEIRAGNSSFTYSGEAHGVLFSNDIGTTGNSYSLQLSLYDNSTGREMSYLISSRTASGFYITPLENGTYRYEYTATEIN